MSILLPILIAVLLGGAFIFQRQRRIVNEQILSDISAQAEHLEEEVTDFRLRFSLVQSDAVDYLNSLGADGSRLLYEVDLQISEIEALLADVTNLIKLGRTSALFEAEQLLQGCHPSQSDGQPGSKRRYCLPFAWEETMEEKLQYLGKGVLDASIEAGVSGLPKRPKTKRTLLNMLDAGIKLD